jgi:hypothetical protein
MTCGISRHGCSAAAASPARAASMERATAAAAADLG